MVTRSPNSSQRSAFTLIELLAVVSIIAVLGISTIASYQAIAGDVRRAGAIEAVKSMLSVGRERAMLDGSTTLVGFRAVKEGEVSRVQAFLAQPAGDVQHWKRLGDQRRVARFLPLADGQQVLLPRGNGVAVPAHRFNLQEDHSGSMVYGGDFQYFATSNLTTLIPEAPGVIPGVLFGRDGAPITMVGELDAEFLWVDFDANGAQNMRGTDYYGNDPSDMDTFAPSDGCWLLTKREPNGDWAEAMCLIDEELPLCHHGLKDEPFIAVGPYLAVFDEKTAREELDTSRWPRSRAGGGRRGRDLTEYIDETARQLHFNRFTGVALEASDR